VFGVDLIIPVTEDYITMSTWITMSDDMGRALTVVVLTVVVLTVVVLT
jgi:hypothetical protein